MHIAVTILVALAGLTAIELRLYESPLSYGPVTIVSGLAVLGLIAYARYFVRSVVVERVGCLSPALLDVPLRHDIHRRAVPGRAARNTKIGNSHGLRGQTSASACCLE